MWLEKQDLEEFAKLWKEEFNETISSVEARLHASQLLELYMLLAWGHQDRGTEPRNETTNLPTS